ncbi:MAG TPA: heavy metal translocating P-type ATPase [Gemmataceae bacterium]|nr:heavy metal translocating P-type ATPase [Gemmataceae bacterium]
MPSGQADSRAQGSSRRQSIIALLALVAICLHVLLRFGVRTAATIYGFPLYQLPLFAALTLGGVPLLLELSAKLLRGQFSSDLLAGISIVTSILLGEYLAGSLVVLMLSGGEALEAYAVRSASSVLAALAKRMPSVAHCKRDGQLTDVELDQVDVGDVLVVFPHEICPVDGSVVEGHGAMDESYLTGEPYSMSKAPGAPVLSGAINGESALTIRADKRAVDSRYAKIMQVMRDSEQSRPRLRRLGDQLGAVYTPIAVALAVAAWVATSDPVRFLAVLVVATPCPLLIAIPVAIIGSISLSAPRGIIVKDPAVLEKLDTCRTAIFDKTGTLTLGRPALVDLIPAGGWQGREILGLVAGLERYSKHPLAGAVLDAARDSGVPLPEASAVSERPGQGLSGSVSGRAVQVTSRQKLVNQRPELEGELPASSGGLECVVLIDGSYAATLRFRDRPRPESAPFIRHLGRRHGLNRVILVSGDRESEVRYLAEQVGIQAIYAGRTPEQKLEIVREETRKANTVFLGDGINDAPALTAATVGIAFGQNSDVTAEAAGAVIMDSTLRRVDEFLHVGHRLRAIALQSAAGGMALSLIGMGFAAAGYLPPVAGAIVQEIIDLVTVVNALRVAIPPRTLTDY